MSFLTALTQLVGLSVLQQLELGNCSEEVLCAGLRQCSRGRWFVRHQGEMRHNHARLILSGRFDHFPDTSRMKAGGRRSATGFV
jgi:hypothetical protein